MPGVVCAARCPVWVQESPTRRCGRCVSGRVTGKTDRRGVAHLGGSGLAPRAVPSARAGGKGAAGAGRASAQALRREPPPGLSECRLTQGYPSEGQEGAGDATQHDFGSERGQGSVRLRPAGLSCWLSPRLTFTDRAAGVRRWELDGRFSEAGREAVVVPVRSGGCERPVAMGAQFSSHRGVSSGCRRRSEALLRPQRRPPGRQPSLPRRVLTGLTGATSSVCDRDCLFFFRLPFQEDETEVPEEVKKAWVSDPR